MSLRERKRGRCQTDEHGDSAIIDFAGAEMRLYVELDQFGEETVIVNIRRGMIDIRPEGANRIRLARQAVTREPCYRRH